MNRGSAKATNHCGTVIYGLVGVETGHTNYGITSLTKDREAKTSLQGFKNGASFPGTPWLRVRRAGLCRGRPGGYAFGKVPQGGPRSRIGLRWALS